jgi:hypothetical protein
MDHKPKDITWNELGASENMKWIKLNEKYSHKKRKVFGNKMESSVEFPKWIP